MPKWFWIALFLFWSPFVSTQIYGDYGVLFGRGLGQMSDHRFFGLDFGFGYQNPCSTWGLGIYMSQRVAGSRTEVLPMYTEFSGYGENVTVENTASHNTMTLNFRFLQFPNDSRWQSYIDLGAGIVTYKNFWNSQGEKIPGSSSFFGLIHSHDHIRDGVVLRNLTFQGTGEIGLTFSWRPAQDDCSGSFSGLSLLMERGGMVQYMLPNRYQEHFYYESGLENQPNAVFSENYFKEARQMTISLRLIVWRAVF
jgi:hypothetical protein